MDIDLEQKSRERVGTVLVDRFRVEGVLGVGGVATVFVAFDRTTNTRVALKVLHAHLNSSSEICERFLREGLIASQIRHPNALKIMNDGVTHDGSPFFVMEYLAGQSLAEQLEHVCVLTPAQSLYVAEQLLDVLACAHDNGVIHRDVKPGNVVLVDDGSVKLVDFGFARVSSASRAATRAGIVLGTVSFMSPEQASARHDLVDKRTDIYSVGALLFTALTGQLVHEGPTQLARLAAVATRPARSVATVAPHLPESLVALIDRALAFKPSDRFVDASSMRNAAIEAARESCVPLDQHSFAESLARPSGIVIGSQLRRPAIAATHEATIDVSMSMIEELPISQAMRSGRR